MQQREGNPGWAPFPPGTGGKAEEVGKDGRTADSKKGERRLVLSSLPAPRSLLGRGAGWGVCCSAHSCSLPRLLFTVRPPCPQLRSELFFLAPLLPPQPYSIPFSPLSSLIWALHSPSLLALPASAPPHLPGLQAISHHVHLSCFPCPLCPLSLAWTLFLCLLSSQSLYSRPCVLSLVL